MNDLSSRYRRARRKHLSLHEVDDRRHRVVLKMPRQPQHGANPRLSPRKLAAAPENKPGSFEAATHVHRRFGLAFPCSAFVRGCPARGVLGGISRYTHEVVLLCQVAGYDPVIVESVGLGQNEVRAPACMQQGAAGRLAAGGRRRSAGGVVLTIMRSRGSGANRIKRPPTRLFPPPWLCANHRWRLSTPWTCWC